MRTPHRASHDSGTTGPALPPAKHSASQRLRLTLKLVWHWFLLGLLPDVQLATRLGEQVDLEGEAATLGEIARRFGADYQRRYGKTMRPEEVRVLRALAACRTALCGWHRYRCRQCGHEAVVYNSCGDGHCPGCQNAHRARWLERRRDELLSGVSYFHIIFPLPQELSLLALYNRQLIYDLLFDKAAETLKQVAATHGLARIGFFGVLHTWGQKLQHHVHLHFVVVGGGLSRDRTQWTATAENYFLPVPILRGVFRAKMLDVLWDAYQQGRLQLSGPFRNLTKPAEFQHWWSGLLAKDWVVHIKPPFAGNTERVLKYLARYVSRVGISNGRILQLHGDQVTFSYRDYSEQGHPEKQLTLPADQFLSRFLQHVLPRGFRRVRHYGFLGGPRARQQLDHIRSLIASQSREGELQRASSQALPHEAPPAAKDTEQLPSDDSSQPSPFACPRCGGPLDTLAGAPRQQCRQLWPQFWHFFPSWSVHGDDTS